MRNLKKLLSWLSERGNPLVLFFNKRVQENRTEEKGLQAGVSVVQSITFNIISAFFIPFATTFV